jgi:predicted ester cyclase
MIVMKKIFAIVFVVASVTLVACNSGGGMSAAAKKNLEVNTAISKAYVAGDFSKMGDYIAADAVDHGGEMGDVKGVEKIVEQMKAYSAMMKDVKMEVVKEMADDEYVMSWAKFSGTLTQDGMGKKAGEKISMTSIDVSKFKDGKAVEHWVFMDGAEVNKMMMGMMQGAPPAEVIQEPKPKVSGE